MFHDASDQRQPPFVTSIDEPMKVDQRLVKRHAAARVKSQHEQAIVGNI